MVIPTTLEVNHTRSQHVLQRLNGALCLPICLRMKGSTKLYMRAQSFLERSLEMWSKLSFSIWNDRKRNPIPPHNLIYVESRISLGYVSRHHMDKVARLCQFVHDNPYGVMLSPRHGKINHEVLIKSLSLQSQNLNSLSNTTRLKMFCLNLMTIRTLGHIFCNVLFHSIPPINLLKNMVHLGGT